MPEASDTLCQTRRVREYEKGSSAPRRTIWKWIGLGLVAVLIGLFSVQYLHPLFPIEEKASCTVTSPSEKGPSTRYNRDLLPRLTTDCGTFSADSAVTCTADPSRKVLLGVGATFDLRVRGPQIAILSNPTVVSAQVAAEQPAHRDYLAGLDDEDLPENVKALRDQFSPETLRAWDYEQPPYDPLCDSLRHVMTTRGTQMMPPERAKEVLRVPEGVAPRDPLLPCRGICGDISRYY